VITIGEGSALFLMTKDKSGIQLRGIGESCDAYHMSAPDPEGKGAALAMRRALEDAGLLPQDISYINLHGTGTRHNDSMESKAVSEIFPEELYCSSTKSLVGHLLGASGATEIGFCWLMLQDPEKLSLPPHVWDGVVDCEIPALNLVPAGSSLKMESEVAVLTNSFAFGGNNCSVILGRTP
jgi:3-oxoacyl-[acyl-carrier-protein] synthase-1